MCCGTRQPSNNKEKRFVLRDKESAGAHCAPWNKCSLSHFVAVPCMCREHDFEPCLLETDPLQSKDGNHDKGKHTKHEKSHREHESHDHQHERGHEQRNKDREERGHREREPKRDREHRERREHDRGRERELQAAARERDRRAREKELVRMLGLAQLRLCMWVVSSV